MQERGGGELAHDCGGGDAIDYEDPCGNCGGVEVELQEGGHGEGRHHYRQPRQVLQLVGAVVLHHIWLTSTVAGQEFSGILLAESQLGRAVQVQFGKCTQLIL